MESKNRVGQSNHDQYKVAKGPKARQLDMKQAMNTHQEMKLEHQISKKGRE